MRRPVSRGMRYAPSDRRARGAKKRRPAMKKTSTVRVNGNVIFKGHKLTTGLDLGDRWSNYCVLDEAGEDLLEQKVATTPEAMKQTFQRIPRSLIALETGTHSPWVSRLLTELGYLARLRVSVALPAFRKVFFPLGLRFRIALGMTGVRCHLPPTVTGQQSIHHRGFH